MSANVMREDVEAALAAGATNYISKPFSPAELRAALEDAAKLLVPAEPPTRVDDEPVLCLERVENHLQVDPSGAFLQALVKSFADTSGNLLTRLATALRLADSEEVRAVLHEYAGMAGVIGAEKLLNLVRELQHVIGPARLQPNTVNVIAAAEREAVVALNAYVSHHRPKRAPDARSSKSVRRASGAPKRRN